LIFTSIVSFGFIRGTFALGHARKMVFVPSTETLFAPSPHTCKDGEKACLGAGWDNLLKTTLIETIT
jgi:hypothetical protein